MYKLLIKITIIASLLISSAGEGYMSSVALQYFTNDRAKEDALRPMASKISLPHPRYFISTEPDSMLMIADKIDNLGKNQHIFSIGPGKLELEKELLERGHTVFCADVTNEYLSGSGLPYILADINRLELQGRRFHTILLCESIGYLSSLSKGIEEIGNLLLPGGHIVVVQPRPTAKKILELYISRFEEDGTGRKFFPHYKIQSPTGTDYNFYPAKKIKGTLEGFGFMNISHLALFPNTMLGLRDLIIARKPQANSKSSSKGAIKAIREFLKLPKYTEKVVKALEDAHGNIERAAGILKVSKSALTSRIKLIRVIAIAREENDILNRLNQVLLYKDNTGRGGSLSLPVFTEPTINALEETGGKKSDARAILGVTDGTL
ncbi:MAG: hypothetical protein ABH843_00740 [Candidatus Omnitrophota bacterium]